MELKYRTLREAIVDLIMYTDGQLNTDSTIDDLIEYIDENINTALVLYED